MSKISDYPEVKNPEALHPAVHHLNVATCNATTYVHELERRLKSQTEANDWQANQLKAERHNAGVLAQNLGAVTKERDELTQKVVGLQIEVAELKAQRAQHTTDAVHQDALMSERIYSLETQLANVRACNDRQAKLLNQFSCGDLIKADQRVRARSEYEDMKARAVAAEQELQRLRIALREVIA